MQHKWAIFKTGNGESGNGEWERGMGICREWPGNLRGIRGESTGNLRGMTGESAGIPDILFRQRQQQQRNTQ